MIAFAHNTYIYVGIYDPTDGGFKTIDVSNGVGEFNSPSAILFYQGQAPRLTVYGTEVGVAWQEARSMNEFFMAGRRIQ